MAQSFPPPQKKTPSSPTPPVAARRPWAGLRSAVVVAVWGVWACGPSGVAESTLGLAASLPRCDASLLHPRITVAAVASLPGKQIVYVDGVMACMDEAARVDQIVSQIEARAR